MWKDAYTLGVTLIDSQHKALFEIAENLVNVLEANESWETQKPECKKVLEFMKNYVVMHFQQEEEYQKEINYQGIEKHKKLHALFTADVLEHEKKLVESDYDKQFVKQFAGTMTAWLINHVADEDQKIVRGEYKPQPSVEGISVIQSFVTSISQTLERMMGIDPKLLKGSAISNLHDNKEVYAKLGIIGELEGNVVYGFSDEFVLNAIRNMTMMDINHIDEMAYSAVAEISNIISGNSTIILSEKGISCDITTPELFIKEMPNVKIVTKFLLDTPLGQVVVGTSFAAH